MYLNLYLFAACFLPLITWIRPARNNFQVGTNLAAAQTLVDQPFNDKDQLFARDVSNYTNDYLERREESEIIEFSTDWSIVGMTENSENSKHCVATNVGKGGHALTAAHCVHSGKAPLLGIKFTVARLKGDKIKHKSMTIDSVITFGDWGESRSPYHDIAVIHIEGYEPHRLMNMETTGVLSRGSKVDILSVTPDHSKMIWARATITQIGTGSVFELLTDTVTWGAPVFVAGDDDALTIYGVISRWEEDDDDEENHYSVAGITPDKLSEIQRLIGPI